MRTRHVIAIALIGASGGCLPQLQLEDPELAPTDVETTLFLIGDAGEADPRAPRGGVPLESLTVQASVAPQRSVIVFLGDNVYPDGIPADGVAEFADARRRLEAQVRAVRSEEHTSELQSTCNLVCRVLLDIQKQ